jgi:hypothetical protein
MIRCWQVTPKEQFDCCARLAELAFNSFNARRDKQWKITVSSWGLLLLTPQFLFTKIHLNPNWFVCVGLGVLVVTIHGLFVRGIWIKNTYDERTFYYFRNAGVEILSGHAYKTPGLPKPLTLRESWGFLRHGSSQFQISTTALLCALCITIILTAKPD